MADETNFVAHPGKEEFTALISDTRLYIKHIAAEGGVNEYLHIAVSFNGKTRNIFLAGEPLAKLREALVTMFGIEEHDCDSCERISPDDGDAIAEAARDAYD